MAERFVARLATRVGGPDRNGGFMAVADDVADVLACAGWL
jgi:hypothetical protein